MHVQTIILHVDIIFLHVDIIFLHVDIIDLDIGVRNMPPYLSSINFLVCFKFFHEDSRWPLLNYEFLFGTCTSLNWPSRTLIEHTKTLPMFDLILCISSLKVSRLLDWMIYLPSTCILTHVHRVQYDKKGLFHRIKHSFDHVLQNETNNFTAKWK